MPPFFNLKEYFYKLFLNINDNAAQAQSIKSLTNETKARQASMLADK